MIVQYVIPKVPALLRHILYLPQDGQTRDKPLLIYLHGAGERGTALSHLSRHAIPRLIDGGREYDAVVLCPQCPADAVWDNVTGELKATIDAVIQACHIKSDRIVLTGSSMGGYGTWMMGMTYRNFFAAIAPVAGGGMSWRVENLRGTPVYAAHGSADAVVPVACTQGMVAAMRRAGQSPKLVIWEEYGHNDGIEAIYEQGKITDWLLAQRRTDFSRVPEVGEDLF